MVRREAREYREYLSAEQRSQPGCPARELCREPRGQDTRSHLTNGVPTRTRKHENAKTRNNLKVFFFVVSCFRGFVIVRVYETRSRCQRRVFVSDPPRRSGRARARPSTSVVAARARAGGTGRRRRRVTRRATARRLAQRQTAREADGRGVLACVQSAGGICCNARRAARRSTSADS